MRRREFIGLVGGAAAWPVAARSQQPPMSVIGFLSSRSPGESAKVVTAFRQGLSEARFVEGQNLVITYRWAEGRYDRLAALAADLIGLRVAVILAAGGPPAALAAKAATETVPIVFSGTSDPVGLGLVASLNRPGGNVTGMAVFNPSLSGKRLEELHELIPKATVIAHLINPTNPSSVIETKEAESAARALGIKLLVLHASTEQELTTAFASLANLHIGGLVVAGEPFFDTQRDRIVELSVRLGVPVNYAWREYVEAGGLMSYGTSISKSYRQAGIYVGRILEGEKPADLPVAQPTKFEMVINLKTAKMLGLIVPASLLARADELIE